jgi:hypothetical protein
MPVAPPDRGSEVDFGSAMEKALDLLKASQVVGMQGHDHPHRMT